ncbi:MAG: hypothetical protein KGI92_01800 [Alphaproteobacteria bacterium]|nr:hypothetical protein [Alphaproteobacteria bacterium]MDE1967614.1 hypothetical protein [Alphaproteobacteria bacterium]MDE2514312.1 hypothetical protein [Alphaproteobacteria bacterium]
MTTSRFNLGIVWRVEGNSAKGTMAAASPILIVTGSGRAPLDRTYRSGLA